MFPSHDPKRKLDEAIADVKAFDTLKGALDSIAETTGEKLADIYADIMKVINLKPPTETVSTPPPVIPSTTEQAQEVVTDTGQTANRNRGQIIIQNQFNITGELNSDEVAIKTIQAQKRGINVVL